MRPYFKGTLLVTLGSRGAVAFDEQDRRYETPSMQGIQIVDTTGAGDAFMGGMLYTYLLQGMPLQQAIEFSTICAGITCTKLGARSAPTLEEVRARL